LRAADRTADHPLVIAGGSGCYNPEPMSAFFDAMIIGEGEEVIFEVIAAYEAVERLEIADWKLRLTPAPESPRSHSLTLSISNRVSLPLVDKVAAIPGVYVPALYDVSYAADGTLAAVTPQSSRPRRRRCSSGW
jgi:radical SAM superfamily enzyme YgiQ (UPF0313 family)